MTNLYLNLTRKWISKCLWQWVHDRHNMHVNSIPCTMSRT